MRASSRPATTRIVAQVAQPGPTTPPNIPRAAQPMVACGRTSRRGTDATTTPRATADTAHHQEAISSIVAGSSLVSSGAIVITIATTTIAGAPTVSTRLGTRADHALACAGSGTGHDAESATTSSVDAALRVRWAAARGTRRGGRVYLSGSW